MEMNRKRLLVMAVVGMMFVALLVASVPFLGSLGPSSRAKAGGQRIYDVSTLRLGEVRVLESAYKGQDVIVVRRSYRQRELQVREQAGFSRYHEGAADVGAGLPDPPEMDANTRSLDPAVGVYLARPIAHVMCPVFYWDDYANGPDADLFGDEEVGGIFREPCRGALYDVTGRVIETENWTTWDGAKDLMVPPHRWIGPGILIIDDAWIREGREAGSRSKRSPDRA